MTNGAPWRGSFAVDGVDGGAIVLHQTTGKSFELGCTVEYIGAETGLEGKVRPESIEEIRSVSPAKLTTTDLTTVPGPFRWFAGRYGAHTPAALIHDWLIGSGPQVGGMVNEHADRYFRFMMKDIGVRWLRRWIMWSAVAMRTRFRAGGIKQISLIIWVLAALTGTVLLIGGIFATNWPLVGIAALAPVVGAALWVRQYGAGLVAAYSVPWIVPPAILAALAFGVYLVLERGADFFLDSDTAGTETYKYEGL